MVVRLAGVGHGPEAVPLRRVCCIFAKYFFGHKHALVAVMAGTIEGLIYLHRLNKIHRDVKAGAATASNCHQTSPQRVRVVDA